MTPITEGEQVVAQAVYAACAPLLTDYQHQGYAKLYWKTSTDGAPMPYGIVQAQTPIALSRYLSGVQVTVDILLKAVAPIAAGDAAARELAALLAHGMTTLTTPTLVTIGPPEARRRYTIVARWRESPPLPTSPTAWQSGHLYRVRISHDIPPRP